MPRPSTPARDKLVARLDPDTRRRVLDSVFGVVGSSDLVRVEHGYRRTLEDAGAVVGRIVAVAYAPGGGSDTVLVVAPADTAERVVAIPAAHVLRIRRAWSYGTAKPGAYRLGPVLAGPPLS